MLNDKGVAFQPVLTSRVKTYWPVPRAVSVCLQVLRTYWWWVPLLLLSMLVGSAVASHHKVKPPSEAKPTLLVDKDSDLLTDRA